MRALPALLALAVLAPVAVLVLAVPLAPGPAAPVASSARQAGGGGFDHLWCPGPLPEHPLELCNLRASAGTGPGNEVDLAMDPEDPLHLVTVAKGYNYTRNLDAAFMGGVFTPYATTFDGGLTWAEGYLQEAQLDPVLGVLGLGSTPAHDSDPTVEFLPDGTVLAITLRVNDANDDRGLPVFRSGDGGLTFEPLSMAYVGGTDKNWMVSDPLTNNVYVVTLHGNGQTVVKSTDGGLTWSAPKAMCGCRLASIDVGNQGEVYVIGRTGGNIVFTESLDQGATWSPQKVIVPDRGGGSNPTNGRVFRTPQIVQMAVSRADGSIYVVWGDHPANATIPSVLASAPNEDVFLTVSRDGGDTWSPRLRVNDDPTDLAMQFMPQVAVSPKGDVHVAWLDQRFDPSGLTYVVMYAHSSDGETLDPNLLVSDAPSLAVLSHHQSAVPLHTGFFVGDYIGLQASDDRAVIAFPDTRYGRADVFIATVQ